MMLKHPKSDQLVEVAEENAGIYLSQGWVALPPPPASPPAKKAAKKSARKR